MLFPRIGHLNNNVINFLYTKVLKTKLFKLDHAVSQNPTLPQLNNSLFFPPDRGVRERAAEAQVRRRLHPRQQRPLHLDPEATHLKRQSDDSEASKRRL